MDKLKPILTHKFWILCGIALLLPVIGWYLGTGKLAAEIDTRVAAIKALNVPDGSQIPNQDWMDNAAEVQEQRQERLDTAADFLWDEQQKYMTWRPAMRRYVKDMKFEDDLGVDAEQRYRNDYDVALADLVQIVDPLRWNQMTMKEEGKVLLDPSALATLPPDRSIWATTPPSSKEVWYLQEEMWLIGESLEAVRDVNDKAGADSIVKAPVKQISLLQLQGGDLAALAAAGEAVGAEGEGGEAAAHSGGMGGMGGMGSMMMGGMRGDGEGGAGLGGAVDFELAEEVGPNTPVASAEAGAEGEVAADGEMAAHAGGMGANMGATFGEGGMAAGANPLLAEKRYVEDDAAAPFKTRAFKMQVVMDHRQLPELLAELTNSPFPVRIVRVHWTERNIDTRFAGTGGSYGGEDGMPSGGRGMGAMGRSPGMGGMGSRGMGAGAMGSRGMGMGAMGRSPGMGGMGSRGMGAGAMGSRGMGMGAMGRSPGMGGMGSRGMGAGAMGSRGMGMGAMGSRGMGMGSMGSRGMGMSRPGLPGMSGEEGGFGGETGAVSLYDQAMMNPYLAEVVIGGVMTVYRSPLEMAAATETPAEGTEATEGGVAAEGVAPVDGTAPADDTLPTDGTAPTDEAIPTDALPAENTAPADAEAITPEATTPDAVAPEENAALPTDSAVDAAPAPDGTPPAEEPAATPQT